MKTSSRVIGGSLLLVVATACAANKSAQGQAPAAPPAASVPAAASAGAPSTAPADDWAETAGAAGAAGTAAAAGSAGAPATEAPKHPSKLIMASIHGKSGSKMSGRVTLSDKGQGVKIFIEVEGAKPGHHGTHIHEFANCTTPDGSSAGGHFNPEGHEHGLTDKDARHLGDLGNIEVGQDGKGTLQITVPGANLKDTDPHSFILRGLIIHEKKDDGSQPVGNAGARVGCAEIK